MKQTIHRCDFCGCERPERELGVLVMPMTPEQIRLAERCEGVTAEERELRLAISAANFFVVRPEARTLRYDVCGECASALVRARAASIHRLREALADVHDMKAGEP